MNRNYLYGFFAFLFISATYIFICTINPEKAYKLALETGPIEICSVVCYILCACLLFYLFFYSKSITGIYLFRTNKNYFYLLLCLFFLISLGEEISWGQRILDIKTPEWLNEKNMQHEINVHNVGTLFTLFGVRINAARIFYLFVALFFVLIPIISRLSTKVQNIFKKINLPIAPLWIAPLFPINFVIYELILKRIIPVDSPRRLDETLENNFALLFLVVSISFYYFNKKNSSQPRAT